MEHLDARGVSLAESPTTVGLEGLEGADIDHALARAIRQLIEQVRDTVDAAQRA